jgi:hypothetical protein
MQAAGTPSKRDWLELSARRILAFWNSPLPENRLICLSLAAFLAGCCLLRAYSGMDGMRAYTHDGFVFLDAAWRLLNGQHSNVDFFSDHGPFMYLETAFGIWLTHGSPAGFGYAHALVGALLGLWAYFLTSRRLAPVPRALFCMAIVLLAISPSTIGEPVIRTTPATMYNRFGYCMVALAILEAALQRNPSSPAAELAGGFSTGAITAFFLFLKISYFLWMGPLVLLLIPARPQTLRRWIGLAAGFAVALLPFLIYDHGTLMPMINDLRIVGGAKHIQWRWYLIEALYYSVVPLAIFILLAVALLWQEGSRHLARQVSLTGAAVILSGGFLLLTNYQRNQLPLDAIGAILILHLVNFRAPSSVYPWIRGILTLWGTWIILISLSADGAGLVAAAKNKISAAHDPRAQFHSARLAGFTSLEYDYVRIVNDGLSLVEQYRQPGDTVMSMDFSNPFSFGLGMPPALGGTTGLQFNTNFSDAHHPTPEWLIGHAKLVIVPRVYTDGSLQESMPRIYGPYLDAHYHVAGQSAEWKLYRQND